VNSDSRIKKPTNEQQKSEQKNLLAVGVSLGTQQSIRQRACHSPGNTVSGLR
jgi:hypothetical protein